MSMPRADLALNGLHNVFNSMAAGLSACVLDIRKDDIRRALEDFSGVEHPLEPVADIDRAHRRCAFSAARTRATTILKSCLW